MTARIAVSRAVRTRCGGVIPRAVPGHVLARVATATRLELERVMEELRVLRRRPRGQLMKVYVGDDRHARLKALARERRQSMTDLVEPVLRKFLKQRGF